MVVLWVLDEYLDYYSQKMYYDTKVCTPRKSIFIKLLLKIEHESSFYGACFSCLFWAWRGHYELLLIQNIRFNKGIGKNIIAIFSQFSSSAT